LYKFPLKIGGKMKVRLSKFTTRGRITIPAEIRKKYKIKAGAIISFQDEGNKIKLIIKKNS